MVIAPGRGSVHSHEAKVVASSTDNGKWVIKNTDASKPNTQKRTTIARSRSITTAGVCSIYTFVAHNPVCRG